MAKRWNDLLLFQKPPPMVVLLFALSSGILAESWLAIPVEAWWLAGSFSLTACWGVSFHPRSRMLLLLLASVCGGGALAQVDWHFFSIKDVAVYERGMQTMPFRNRLPICVRGELLEEPIRFQAETDRNQARNQLQLRLTGIRISPHRWQLAQGVRTLTVIGELPHYRAGDEVEVWGHLTEPNSPRNPGERDRVWSLRAKHRLGRLVSPHPDCVKLLASADDWRHPIQRLRSWCRTVLQRYITNHSDLAEALFLGNRLQLSPQLVETFEQTGTAHFLAVSGLHVGILAALVIFLARGSPRIPFRLAILATVSMIVIYAVLTGGRAPIFRATTLIVLASVSQLTRRRLSPFNSLATAGLAILIGRPSELFQTGTQLSFLAVATLIHVGHLFSQEEDPDPITRLICKSRPRWIQSLRGVLRSFQIIFTASLAVWLTTLPITTRSFHLLTPAAPVLNSFLWIPLSIAIYSIVGILFCHLACPPLAEALGWFSDKALQGLVAPLKMTQDLSGTHYWLAGPDLTYLLIFYATLTLMMAHSKLRVSKRSWGIFSLLAIGAIYLPPAKPLPHDVVRTTIFSVGHGACALIEYPNDEVWLIDAGSLAARSSVEIVSQALWHRRIREIDTVIISHADLDHYNLLPSLQKRFPIHQIIASRRTFAAKEVRLLLAAMQPLPQLKSVAQGDRLTVGPCQIRLHQPSQQTLNNAKTDNDSSLVFTIECHEHSLLFPGDIDGTGLDELLRSPRQDVDVTLAPHHGSPGSRPIPFAQWSTPEYVIISGGKPGYTRHYFTAVEDHSHIMHTETNGAITITFGRECLRVTPTNPTCNNDSRPLWRKVGR